MWKINGFLFQSIYNILWWRYWIKCYFGVAFSWSQNYFANKFLFVSEGNNINLNIFLSVSAHGLLSHKYFLLPSDVLRVCFSSYFRVISFQVEIHVLKRESPNNKQQFNGNSLKFLVKCFSILLNNTARQYLLILRFPKFRAVLFRSLSSLSYDSHELSHFPCSYFTCAPWNSK